MLARKAGRANFGSHFCRLICVELSIFRRQFPGCVVGVAGPVSEGPGQQSTVYHKVQAKAACQAKGTHEPSRDSHRLIGLP
ncbi:hypothetical protein E2C01_028666 [Portunus trituberculatus]|uniref:Uncharacterized protein n=1 Tax=Portunus trituberculatus TaxID=210409 RepID=A0A5B7EPP7_PORTR|nr:hypothetical protein [Portunus trituberculatus]